MACYTIYLPANAILSTVCDSFVNDISSEEEFLIYLTSCAIFTIFITSAPQHEIYRNLQEVKILTK